MNIDPKIIKYLTQIYPGYKLKSQINEGEGSQTYVMDSNGSKQILRINNSNKGFFKDKLAYEKYRTSRLHVPKVISIDPVDDVFICISEYIEGTSYKKLNQNNRLKYLDDLFLLHLELGKVENLDINSNYSWKEFLLDVNKSSSWKMLASTTSFSIELANKLLDLIKNNLSLIPEKQNLVHGDFGYDNVIINQNNDLYLIDWEFSIMGDSLFDIAWLQFWSSGINYLDHYEKFARQKQIDISNFKKRIEVYSYYIALTSLEWYAESKNINRYSWLEDTVIKNI
ncbi:aminoglycoside phosphotransferase family protein [Patescibacteria group bacterium]|nr:aminoglycoside phosphotransferase family protein [Patescibacteria group bacterium]